MTNATEERRKTVKFDFDFTSDFKLEVSDHGRVHTSNMMADKRLLNVTLTNGYRRSDCGFSNYAQ